ncbi:MAG: class I SAM-dependent methyltransferase [Actinomycetota bacterium]
MSSEPDGGDIDPRRAMWRRGSYEIAGDWVRPASLSVLDRLEEVSGSIDGRRLLDAATGTGAVAIEAARRGAVVVGVDLTDELVDIGRHRAAEAGVEVRLAIGDFDRLDEVIGDAVFDVITSSFGVIFAPDPPTTLAGFDRLLAPDGLVGVTGWDPDGVMMVPDTLLELLPQRPVMPDMSTWTTAVGPFAADGGFEVAAAVADDLVIRFASVADAAEQLERWSGGWAQLLETFDSLGVGGEARARLVEHLAAFSTTQEKGIGLCARFHTSVLRRIEPPVSGAGVG